VSVTHAARFFTACSAFLLLASCGQTPPPAPLADSPQWNEAQKAAQFQDSAANLGRAQAEEVEKFLLEHPDDLDSHKRLLIFYSANGTRFYDPATVVAARRRHVLWLMAHHPEDPLLGTSQALLSPNGPEQIEDKAGYDQAKKMWMPLVAKPDAPAQLLFNAAALLSAADQPETDKLVQQLETRDPQGNWKLRLAAITRKRPDEGTVGYLGLKTQFDYDQGDFDTARKEAQEILTQGSKFQSDPDYGTAVYQADMVMGLLAMQKHDRPTALKYLKDAANGPSTENLANFEQSITYELPRWLLKDGERDSVVQFLERFAKTYTAGQRELLASAELIKKGQKPAWY
jgi:hypothetical protein